MSSEGSTNDLEWEADQEPDFDLIGSVDLLRYVKFTADDYLEVSFQECT